MDSSSSSPNVVFASYVYKWNQGKKTWERYFFTVTKTSVLYYERKYDATSLVGYIDRSLIKGVESLGEEMVEGRKLYTVKLDVSEERYWTLGTAKSKARAELCMEIEPQQEGSFTPKSFQIRKARQGKSPRSPMATMMGAPPTSVVAGGQKMTAQQPVKPDPLQWLARSLSFYEGEWDKSAATETPTVRSKKLEHVLDDLIGTDEKLLTLKGSSIFDELETLIDEMWKNNEQALVQQTIRSTIGRHSGKLPGQYATMTAGKLRGTVIDTLAKKKQKDRRAVSVEDLWSRDIPATGTLVINPDIASKMLEKLNKSDEEGEDD